MKIIIVEGLDNTGKSTYIKNLVEHLLKDSENTEHILKDTDIKVIHFEHIIGITNEDSVKLTDKFNETAIDSLIYSAWANKYEYIILDRSWISEYVYGQLYRERSKDDILQKIIDYNDYLTYKVGYENVELHYFTVDDPQYVINHEDGDSLSIGDNQYECILQEIKLFDEIYNKCDLLKSKIIIDNKDYPRDKDNYLDYTYIHNILKNLE